MGDLGRNYRVTMVALLSGSVEHLMNVDIRVGESDQSGSGNARITGNTRCGIYYGPTLVSNQWVEIDCGYDRGLMGRYLTIQSTERYQVDNHWSWQRSRSTVGEEFAATRIP